MTELKTVIVGNVALINTTPHEITFGIEEGGEIKPVQVPPCGVLINAKATSNTVKMEGGVEYVKTVFEGNAEGEALIEQIKTAYPHAVIVGSIIAAQAYPGEVFGMCPLPGFERVAPAEKRMDPHKFTTF